MFNNDWDNILSGEINKDYFKNIINAVDNLYKEKEIYPKKEDIFNAFKIPYRDVKVVILGQDPYHGEGEAHGYAFSCLKKPIPPSLKNIYKELYSDLGIERVDSDLSDWAKSGVLLLNSVLTVEKDKPASHKFVGWEEFTDNVIKKLNEKDDPVVFILWGNFAKGKMKYITNPKHLIISSSHPSPFSVNYGFLGSKPFSRTNEFLKKNGMEEIEW